MGERNRNCVLFHKTLNKNVIIDDVEPQKTRPETIVKDRRKQTDLHLINELDSQADKCLSPVFSLWGRKLAISCSMATFETMSEAGLPIAPF